MRMLKRYKFLVAGLVVLLVSLAACSRTEPLAFDGAMAYKYVVAQCDFGFRPPGSEALRATGDYIIAELGRLGWAVETQEFTYRDTPVRNIVGRLGEGPVVIVGAHYDTRRSADMEDASVPVMGANDGASGVAVLLELARTLDRDKLRNEVWLAFFDAEDNGNLDGWEWCVGSDYMAENLTITPAAVVVVDMVGDADQGVYLERNSDPALQTQLWDVAASLGYADAFVAEYKYAIFDDHVPFARRGILAVDIIDFDYEYWHTTHDTPDKVSAPSLERVGRVMEVWLEEVYDR
jgi:glutaminyl-peptide cyclotransferase